MDMLLKVISFCLILTAVAADIQVIGNGYKGIAISISPHIEENPNLLTKLEQYWTDASAVLLRATKYQLYFKEFIIILPQEWQPMDFHETFIAVDQDNPDIIIDLSKLTLGNAPYTNQYKGCGEQGLNIHLTTDYILDDLVASDYGPAGKTLVHEWGHYRWGLFDEYPYPTDDKFYRDGNAWYPTGCSSQVDGKIENVTTREECKFDFNTGKLLDGCRFIPNEPNRANASLMNFQFPESIVEFCDDPATAPEHLKHNTLAPTRHNRICNYQSAWEVMRKHTDFTNLTNNEPLPTDTDTGPVFRYVRSRPQAQVLVLDVAGIIEDESLTSPWRQAAAQYITSVIETGSFFGIVVDSDCTTLHTLVEVTSNEVREELVTWIPTDDSCPAGITAGLEEALNMLEIGGYPNGGSIILVNDGETDELDPDTERSIYQRGIKVHAIAMSQFAHPILSSLSKITGGKMNFYPVNDDSTALLDENVDDPTALVDNLVGSSAILDGLSDTNLVTWKNASLTILSELSTVTSEIPLNGTFYIDSTIGRETTLTFSYSQPIAVTIGSPNGPYEAMQIQDYPSLQIIKLVFGNDLTPGMWSYHVTTNSSSLIVANIQSKSRTEETDVLRVYSWISEKDDITFDVGIHFGVYTTVSRGQLSVLNANVIATVERPESNPISLNLVDNGIGSDIIKDDGIYSGTIIAPDLTGDGRYNIKIKVVGTKNETKISVGGSSGAMDRNMNGVYQVTETDPLEDFQRASTAGEFRIVDFNQTALDESPDRIPPARIMDLRVKSLDVDNATATLVWTAVGGDFDRGQAAEYIVYIGHDLESMIGTSISAGRLPEQHVIKGNLSSALAQGEREEYVILVEDLRTGGNNTLFLCVVAVDKIGNKGGASNVVTLSNATVLSVPIQDINVDKNPSNNDNNDHNDLIYILIGIFVPSFVLTYVAITAYVVLVKKPTKVDPSLNMQ